MTNAHGKFFRFALVIVSALLSFAPSPFPRKAAAEAKAAQAATAAQGVKTLIAQLDSKDDTLKIEAIHRLKEMKKKSAIEPLVRLLSHGSDSVRWEATQALINIGAPAIDALIGVLGSENQEARWKAGNALEKIGGPSVLSLIAALKGDNVLRRREAVYILGKLKDTRSIAALAAALRDRDRDVRWKAAVALKDIGQPAVEAAIGELKGPNVFARQCAAWVFQKIKDKRAAQPLAQALVDADKDVRGKAGVALKEMGPLAREALLDALKSGAPNVKEAAYLCLKDSNEPEVQKALRRFERKKKAITIDGRRYAPLKLAKHDQYNFEIVTEPVQPGARAKQINQLDFLLALRNEKNYYRLLANAKGVRLSVVEGGRKRAIAARQGNFLPSSSKQSVLIKRRKRVLYFIINNVIALRAFDSTFSKGGFFMSVRSPSGLELEASSLEYTPIEDVRFSDDFMRTEEEAKELGGWQPAAGQSEWKLYSVLDRIRANPDARIREGFQPEAQRSPNPFCLSGKAEKGAIITNGYDFWDDYRAGVSAKTHGGKFGLVVAYRNPKDYYLLRWELISPAQHAGKVELVRMRAGGEKVLGEKYALGRTDNWYRLELEIFGDRIRAFMDKTLLFDIFSDSALAGEIGLYAAGEGLSFFDDVVVESREEILFDTPDALSGNPIAGQWKVVGAAGAAEVTSQPTNPPGAQNLYAFGDAKQRSCVLDAEVRPLAAAKEVGLAFGVNAADDYWLFKIAKGAQAGTAVYELIRRKGDKIESLVKSRGRFTARSDEQSHPTNLMIDLTERGVAKFYVDGVLELRYRDAAPLGDTLAAHRHDSVEEAVGKSGLYAVGGATFSSISWRSSQTNRDWEQHVGRQIFEHDPYMQGWASPRWAWTPLVKLPEVSATSATRTNPPQTGAVYVHKGDFYGAFDITLPVQNGLTLSFGGETTNPAEAYAVDVALDEKKKLCTVGLKRAGKVIATKSAAVSLKEVAIPQDESAPQQTEKKLRWGKVIVRREGKYVLVAVNEAELISFRDDSPLKGRRVGIAATGELDLSEIDVRRDHVRDYLFERAPIEWQKLGTWEVTNRFACDPRWSHLNGRSFGIAALWNKHEFQGDFTLEYYAGMRMRQGALRGAASSSYPRVGDINISFCGDGKDIFSGYDLIIAAWDPLWSEKMSKLYRGEKVVQQTDKELIPRTRDHSATARVIQVGWDPGGRPIHGAWYYIKLRRIGKKIEFYFDNELVMTYDDPQPLSGARLALWTQANSIVVARARICYEKMSRPMAKLVPPKRPEIARIAEAPPTRAIEINSTTHPSCYFDFENDLNGWRPTNGEQSASLSLDAAEKPVLERIEGSAGRASLKLTNIYPGGDFGAKIPIPKLDLSRVTDFGFDYNIPPGVETNLYISLEGEAYSQYFIQLTGNDFSNDNMLRVGKINVVQDGKWHRATFDIAGAFKSLYPMRTSFIAADVRIGNFHEGYSNAGFGGNKMGAFYHIDNFQLLTAGPDVAEFECAADENIAEYKWIIDQQATTSPLTPPQGTSARTAAAKQQPAKSEGAKPSYVAAIKSDKLAPGVWYFHVCSRIRQNSGKADGKWTEPQHHPFRVCAPLTVTKTTPPPGAKWGGDPITIQFSTSTPADLVVPGVKLTTSGKTIPINAQTAAYKSKKRLLRLDLRQADIVFDNNQPIEFVLSYSDNLRQNPPTTATHKWSYVMDYGLDKSPPSLVKVGGRLVHDDFEEGIGQWTPYGGIHGATLVRDSSTAASGRYSLKMINRIVGGGAGAVIYPGSFNIGRYPIISFDYKTDGHLRADLYTKAGSHQRGITFTDNDTTLSIVGAASNVQKDNKWHHAEINWKKMFDTVSSSYDKAHYSAAQLILGDFGHAANSPGVTCHIDNFDITPAHSGVQGVTLSWTARDPSGIAGYSYSWSAKPDEVPDTTSEGQENKKKFDKLPEGSIYFHVRAQDGAGNWGVPSHYRYIVDSTPPTIGRTSPAASETSASSTIEVAFNDAGTGIDPASLSMTMNGKHCALNANYATLDAVKGKLTFDWVRSQKIMDAPIPNGAPMTFALQPIKDFVGNTSQPLTWTWKIDHSKDQVGPLAPSISCSTHKLLIFDSFTDSAGQWTTYGNNGAELELHLDKERRDYCLKLTNQHKHSSFGAYVRRGNFNPETYPIVCFEYKIPPRLSLMLIIHIGRRWYAIELTKASSVFENIGKAPGIIADGKWRTAVFNLHEMLEKAFPDVEKQTITYIAIGDWSRYDNPVGATYYLDNFSIMGKGGSRPVMSWTAVDSTGIDGYSYTMDMNSRGEADTKAEGRERSNVPVQILDKQGLWYLHVRARDGAGNWGATAHYPYYCVDIPHAAKGDGLETEAGWTAQAISRRNNVNVELTDTVLSQNKMMMAKYSSPQRRAYFTLTHSGPYDLTGKKEIALNLYNPSNTNMTVTLKLTTPENTWYMSKPQKVPGHSWVTPLEFSLTGKIFRRRGTRDYAAAFTEAQETSAISFVVASRQRQGYLLVDDVRVR